MIIIPASNDQICFVRIGNYWNYPSTKDLKEISEWVRDHRDAWPACRKELPNPFGYDIKVRYWPAIKSNREYVWVIDQPGLDSWKMNSDDIQQWKDVFAGSFGDPDFIIFVWGGMSIKRINKNLVPMI